MLTFVNIDPKAYKVPKTTTLKCANISCENNMLFCDAVIWHWNDGKPNNAGFCGHECALDAMSYAAMGSA